ncbi:DNA-directed RNA polymerase III subunit RPC4 isoform X1 [Anastrepha obliqua]|uniref:DNA-directed RNA polymerase III subunit RPC4 isoform X1 n=1 Tax=Anastrepha obliqua TaxID=95512 RepID=UPI002408F9EE|nr:DNA-directed RNA polymerase III subunit RPC4 isoform X1 [Anastrepha obliqua]
MNGSSAATTPTLHKLSSLKPARDLTLGGRGGAANANAAKKVFTPNLNVVRNKNTNVKTSKDTTVRGRGAGRGGRGGRGSARGGRGGAAGGANSSLIQTTGVFSEGAGAVNIRKPSSGGSSFGGRSTDDAPSQMRRPTIIKSEKLKKIDLKADDEHIRELLGDSDEDDFGDEKTDLEQIPVKLNEIKWKSPKVEIKLEKLEDGINGEAAENVEDFEPAVNIAQQIQSLVKEQQRTNSALARYPASIGELLDLPQSQLFLLQLPDALPCEDDVEEIAEKTLHEKNAATDTPSTSQNPPAAKPPPKRMSLKEMEEGKIGKLLRYKSGKVKLVFGNTYYDLGMGMETGFLQDLMSINTNREERSGNMINLGAIQAKITATPDWEHLMEQEERRQRPKPA